MEGMNTNNIMDINRILDEARELGCSDLHFTAGLPPVVRLHGSIRKLSGYPDCTEPIVSADITLLRYDFCATISLPLPTCRFRLRWANSQWLPVDWCL